ncbi:Amidophosphoribosyltransferase [Diplonema papillatum]|nr:Amidophosphoribosyltransferase [Diplonema papillatum]
MCGIVFLRLLKPPEYYVEKYGTGFYAIGKMHLLMEKMQNRGQDGAGVVNIKLDPAPGKRYISRSRSNAAKPVQDVFDHVNSRFKELGKDDPAKLKDGDYLKENFAFTGEVWMGHLRYGTYGGASIEHCHPFLRQNNWMTRCLTVAGNFNLTNVDELYDLLINLGQHPKERSDTVTVMEKIGHFLDLENEQLFQKFKQQGFGNKQITQLIAESLDVRKILKNSAQDWDGGYAMGGIFGHGDAFVLRDPNGIRPCFYYIDEEVVVVASERAPIMTAFGINRPDLVKEVKPGHALIVKKSGAWSEVEVKKPAKKLACTFERIYFSRGSDRDIYNERFDLGRCIAKKVACDVSKNAVVGYIPNTAETCFYGFIKGFEEYLDAQRIKDILRLQEEGKLDEPALQALFTDRPRYGKPLIKDTKARTFITSDAERENMVALVYDITYDIAKHGVDTVILIDDSIVRGTTLKTSVIRILSRLEPKKIVIVSSAPQIRYPDCYGIDMARMSDFCAFRAAVALLKDHDMEDVLQIVYKKCKLQEHLPKEQVRNCVKEIYEPFSPEQISQKITDLLKPPDLKCELEIIFQSLEGLAESCPNHHGNWYFSGDYPTPGGNKVVNRAFIYYMEGNNARAY